MFETSDFYSAVVLRSLGWSLTDMKPSEKNRKKVFFVFDTEKMAEHPNDILQEYWDGTLTINARSFVEAINEIKTRLYDSR